MGFYFPGGRGRGGRPHLQPDSEVFRGSPGQVARLSAGAQVGYGIFKVSVSLVKVTHFSSPGPSPADGCDLSHDLDLGLQSVLGPGFLRGWHWLCRSPLHSTHRALQPTWTFAVSGWFGTTGSPSRESPEGEGGTLPRGVCGLAVSLRSRPWL